MPAEIEREHDEDEINLLDYWRILKKRGGLVVGLVAVSVLATGSLSYFVLTKIYESTATILAPKESAGGSAGVAAALAASGAGQIVAGLLPPAGTNRDAFVAILKSRTMAQDLVDRFKLKDHYQKELTEDAVKALQQGTEVRVSREGAISITVENKDPKLAADIANAYIAHLDRMFAKLGTTDAGRQRAFVADRLEMTEKALRQAEDALRRFQEKNKAVVIQEQAKTALEAAARVKGEIIAAEVALEAMRSFATEANPQVVQQKIRVQELKRQLAQMQFGAGMDLPSEGMNPVQSRREFQLPFTRVPEVGMDLARLTREVKIQETVFTLLTQQFEQAKILEARDTPVVQVLDKAVPAERKSRPRTTLNMAIAGTLSLFVAIFLAFFLEYVERVRARERRIG